MHIKSTMKHVQLRTTASLTYYFIWQPFKISLYGQCVRALQTVYSAHSVLSCIVVCICVFTFIFIHIAILFMGTRRKMLGVEICSHQLSRRIEIANNKKEFFFCKKFDALNKNNVLPFGLKFKQAHQCSSLRQTDRKVGRKVIVHDNGNQWTDFIMKHVENIFINFNRNTK